ncbi:MAG: NAD(P)H-dependent oxidoreductase subunit E [Candidatus Binatia bacterium]|nr:NAD(P)H-dependent oxidoreductase subunit E [Candidatus Binatia bacterium]
MAVQFSQETYRQFEEVLTHYPTKRAALLPTFWLAQEEFGYLSPEVMEYIAQLLDLSPAYVAAVASFYTMFDKEPKGKFHLQVCTNLSCTLVGAQQIVECLEQKLGIKLGETTPDGKFSLSEVECLGSCGTAPVLQLNTGDYYENLTPERVTQLVEELAKQA